MWGRSWLLLFYYSNWWILLMDRRKRFLFYCWKCRLLFVTENHWFLTYRCALPDARILNSKCLIESIVDGATQHCTNSRPELEIDLFQVQTKVTICLHPTSFPKIQLIPPSWACKSLYKASFNRRFRRRYCKSGTGLHLVAVWPCMANSPHRVESEKQWKRAPFLNLSMMDLSATTV